MFIAEAQPAPNGRPNDARPIPEPAAERRKPHIQTTIATATGSPLQQQLQRQHSERERKRTSRRQPVGPHNLRKPKVGPFIPFGLLPEI